MKIEPEGVWKERYKAAYLRTKHSTGRWMVDLVNTDKDRTTVSYAKYILSIHLGRILSREEQVDHINGDKNDDRIENLQVLSKEEHLKKSAEEMKVPRIEVTCTYCGKVIERLPCQVRAAEKRGAQFFCSYSCNGKSSSQSGRDGPLGGKLTKDQVLEIKESQEEAKVLAARYGVSKNTIYNIWWGKTWKDIN